MDDKTIIDITSVDAEKHAENVAKRAAAYSKNLLHHASILSEKEYQKFILERLEKDNGYVIRKASNFDRSCKLCNGFGRSIYDDKTCR